MDLDANTEKEADMNMDLDANTDKAADIKSNNHKYGDIGTYAKHMMTHVPPSPCGSIAIVDAGSSTTPPARRAVRLPKQPVRARRSSDRGNQPKTDRIVDKTDATERVQRLAQRALRVSEPDKKDFFIASVEGTKRVVEAKNVALRAAKVAHLRRHTFPRSSTLAVETTTPTSLAPASAPSTSLTAASSAATSARSTS